MNISQPWLQWYSALEVMHYIYIHIWIFVDVHWPPRHNWTIVDSGVKHSKHIPPFSCFCIQRVLFCGINNFGLKRLLIDWLIDWLISVKRLFTVYIVVYSCIIIIFCLFITSLYYIDSVEIKYRLAGMF